MRRAGLLVVLLWFLPGAAGAQGIGIGMGIGNTGAMGKPRGRLVVACDMRSDTCSDGRKITTKRATPVPCETSPGVWETVGVDEGCYSVRGLEAWAQNTSYLSYGAELGLNPPWVPGANVSVAAVESFWRVCGEVPSNQLQNATRGEDGVPVTASCIVRAATSGRMGIQAAPVSLGGNIVDYNLTSEWQTVSATTTLSGSTQAFARILPSRSGPGCIDAIGCWLTKSATPGRPCWGGEAPVTCSPDSHTISTEGWPTTDGEICITADIGNVTDSMLFDSRIGGGATFVRVLGGRLYINDTAGTPGQIGPGTHRVCVRADGGFVSATVNGQPSIASHARTLDWGTSTYLGRSSGGLRIDGALPSLRVRSFE